MSMKRILRLTAALGLVFAMAFSMAVTSSATFFKAGEAAELLSEEALTEEEPYIVVVKEINSFVLRLFGKTLINPARNSTPFRSVTIDESAEDVVKLEGGENTLAHLQIEVYEDEKTIVITMPDHLFWVYAGSSVDITIGVPVKRLSISQSDKVTIDYQNAGVSAFELSTQGPIETNCSFAELDKLTADIQSGGHAVFSGSAAEVAYNLSGLSTVYAFDLPTSKANISVSGSSIAKQFFTEGAELIGKISSYSEIWYDYEYYAEDDYEQEHLLLGPNVDNVNVATGARLVKLRKIV